MDDRELLLAYLADRDIPCPSCFYNLRGNTAAACPECGSVLALKNNIVRIKLRRDKPPARPGDWRHRIAMSGLTIPAVLFALLVIASAGTGSDTFDAMRTQSAPQPDLDKGFWFPKFAGLVLFLSAAIVLGNLKPQFQRRSAAFQRVAMLLCWHWLPVLAAMVVAPLL